MTLVAYYDNKLIADQCAVLGLENSNTNTKDLRKKLHVSKCNRFAWTCAGNLPLNRDLEKIEAIFLEGIEDAYKNGVGLGLTTAQKDKVIDRAGVRSYILMTFDRASHISNDGFIEFNEGEMFVHGTGRMVARIAYAAGIPAEDVIPLAASIIPTVSVEFDICLQSSLTPFIIEEEKEEVTP